MSNYRAVWDSRTWVVTMVVTAALAFVVYQSLRLSVFATPRHFGRSAVFGTLVVLAVVALMVFAPRAYRIDGWTLHIRTILADFSYDLSRVLEVREATQDELFPRGTLRAGSGGLFGYIGYFRNRNLGTFLSFVTDRHELVVLRYRNRVLVISPHHRERFLKQVRAVIRQR